MIKEGFVFVFLFNVAVNTMKVILATVILQTIGVQVLPHRDMRCNTTNTSPSHIILTPGRPV